jgi:hypothetical protein
VRWRNAVGQGEGRDGLDQHPGALDDQEQAKDEEQVVHAQQDVLDPQPEVRQGALAAGGAAAQGDHRGRGAEQVAFQPAVGVMDSHQHVGDGGFQAGDGEDFVLEATFTAEHAADHHGAG